MFKVKGELVMVDSKSERTLLGLTAMMAVLLIVLLSGSSYAEVVTLRWATWGSEHVDRQLIAAFEKEYPNIRIEYVGSLYAEHHEKMKMLSAAGVAPDVFVVDGYYIAEFADSGLIQPIDHLLAQETTFDMSEYFPAALPDVQFQGVTYGLPYISAPQYMIYNATHFEESGLSRPDPHWDRETFVEYAQKLRRSEGDRVIRYGSTSYLGWASFWSWVWSAGGSAFDANHKKFTLTEREAIDGLEWLAQMQTMGITGSGNFMNETVSIGAFYPASFPSVTGVDWDFDWDVTLWPAGPGGQYSIWKGNAMAISSSTPHLEEAWTFLKFLLAPESTGHRIYVQNRRFQPQTRDAELWHIWEFYDTTMSTAPSLLEVTLLLASNHGRALPQLLQWDEIMQNHVARALQQISTGLLEPAVAMEQIRPPIERLLMDEP